MSPTTSPPISPTPRLVLASRSPRRQDLLREAGYVFEIAPADIPEDDNPPPLPPIELAAYLARAKADAICNRFPDDVILAADTVVAFGDRALGKPTSPDHAREMLALLAGTTHIVITGIAVMRKVTNFSKVTHVMTAVMMRSLSAGEIDRYVATNDWEGKAGGYGIQDADPFVTKLRGDVSNVVGLPMKKTRELLSAVGVEPTR